MSNPGVDVYTSGVGGPSLDGGASVGSVKAFGGVGAQAQGRPAAPSSSAELAALLGDRLRNEDAFQMTLEHMFKKIDEQEKVVGQLRMTVSDLETAHQPWPKADFEKLSETVTGMTKRLDTLPPDTALVTKKYLKEYDNQWVTKWKAMEEETGDRFDRLETRLGTFEENVLRVELKIENDVKQCLVELGKCLKRLDEVEETGKETMRIGFERIERDITDLTLKMQDENKRLGKVEEVNAQTADKILEVIMAADETNEKVSTAQSNIKILQTDLKERTDDIKTRLRTEVEKIEKTMVEAAEVVNAHKQQAEETGQQLEATKQAVTNLATAVATQEANVQGHASSLAELKQTVDTAVEAIKTTESTVAAIKSAASAPAPVHTPSPVHTPPAGPTPAPAPAPVPAPPAAEAPPPVAAAPAVSTSMVSAPQAPIQVPTFEPPAAAMFMHSLPPQPVDPGVSEEKVKEIVTESVKELLAEATEAIDGRVKKTADEIREDVSEIVENLTSNVNKLQESIGANNKAVKEATIKVKAAVDANEQARSEIDILMKNILMKEEQDRWRGLLEQFDKDLDFFKRKYTRHLGLQVENYTVAGMAKEEDLERLAGDMESKVGRNELTAFMDKAVERAIHVYTTMQQEADADALTLIGGQKLKSRCMACDRDLSMVSAGPGTTMLGPGLLTAGARSMSPSKNPQGKSKGFLPKIAQPSGPSGPGLNPMEMDRLKRLADIGGQGRSRPSSPLTGFHDPTASTSQDQPEMMVPGIAT